eukprot:GHVL01012475.1.p1 GENE.GHVL01012475.1~~GHVL01012475.1.p1  ORF type:complete len:144 (+),score=22.74 GHVL01012475.1:18-449(+)
MNTIYDNELHCDANIQSSRLHSMQPESFTTNKDAPVTSAMSPAILSRLTTVDRKRFSLPIKRLCAFEQSRELKRYAEEKVKKADLSAVMAESTKFEMVFQSLRDVAIRLTQYHSVWSPQDELPVSRPQKSADQVEFERAKRRW